MAIHAYYQLWFAKELGIEPTTPDEARQILGLKGPDKVNFYRQSIGRVRLPRLSRRGEKRVTPEASERKESVFT